MTMLSLVANAVKANVEKVDVHRAPMTIHHRPTPDLDVKDQVPTTRPHREPIDARRLAMPIDHRSTTRLAGKPARTPQAVAKLISAIVLLTAFQAQPTRRNWLSAVHRSTRKDFF